MEDTFNLAHAGVIAKLHIRQWSGNRLDRAAGRKTAASHGATEKAVKVHKALVDADHLEALKKVANEARTYHYQQTIGWTDGAQFLPSRLSPDYWARMQELKMQFDQQARAFCCGYPTYRAQARVFLGTLYRDADYPCDVSSLFSFEVAFEPVPDSAHFFTDLAAAQLAHFRADLERRNQERMMLMQRELYERLIEPVRKMAEALQQPDKIFRDTLVGNVGDIAELMDGLNVFGDPFLAEAAAELRRTLATLNPETLRNSPRERQKAAEDARRMADSIAARMGPFMGAIAPAVAA